MHGTPFNGSEMLLDMINYVVNSVLEIMNNKSDQENCLRKETKVATFLPINQFPSMPSFSPSFDQNTWSFMLLLED